MITSDPFSVPSYITFDNGAGLYRVEGYLCFGLMADFSNAEDDFFRGKATLLMYRTSSITTDLHAVAFHGFMRVIYFMAA